MASRRNRINLSQEWDNLLVIQMNSVNSWKNIWCELQRTEKNEESLDKSLGIALWEPLREKHQFLYQSINILYFTFR